MKVLMISTDRNLFNKDSAVYARTLVYSQQVEHLSVIVFSLERDQYKEESISNQFNLHPTGSRTRLLYIFDAIRIAIESFSQGAIPDIITVQDPFETGIVGWYLAPKIKRPLQVQVHTDLFSPYFKKVSVLNRVRVIIAGFVIPKSNGIRVVSLRLKKSIEDRYTLAVPIRVLPVYVDKDRLLHKIKDREFLYRKYPEFLLFALVVSRLENEKNITFAIDVFKEVATDFPKLALVIVGNGKLEKILREKAKILGLENRIKFEGWVDDPSLYFQSATVFLNTSYYEGYGMTLLEATTAGTPTVTTNVGIAKDIEGDGVRVVDVGAREKFVEALRSYLNSPEQRIKIRVDTPDTHKYLLERDVYIKEYISLWEELIKKE
jgi:glycosyltransferase involved in cell wall biosynthesis